MDLVTRAISRLAEADDALSRGDYKNALFESTASVSVVPSTRGFLIRAQTNYILGDFAGALSDINNAENHSVKDDPSDLTGLVIHDLKKQIMSAVDRHAVEAHDFGPKIDQIITAIIPLTGSPTDDQIYSKLLSSDLISTDLRTLIRKDVKSAPLYDVELLPPNSAWAESMLYDSMGCFSQAEEKLIRDHCGWILLRGPNQEVASGAQGQFHLASDMVFALMAVQQILDSIGTYILTSHLVQTAQDMRNILNFNGRDAHLNKESLVHSYVRMMRDNSTATVFSCGMHALGYPDVEIPLHLLLPDTEADVLKEFLLCLMVNGLFAHSTTTTYTSGIAACSYFDVRLKESPNPRFDQPTEFRRNKYGIYLLSAPFENTLSFQP